MLAVKIPKNSQCLVRQALACGGLVGLLLISACDQAEDAAIDSDDSVPGSGVQSDWPLFRGDPQMQGVSPESISPPLELVWSHEPVVEEGKRRPPIEASPVIADGIVFVGTQGGQFLALSLETGDLNWSIGTEGPVTAPAAVDAGTVYFGDTYGFVYALDALTGEENWRYETDGKIEGGVNIFTGKDGKTKVFVGSHDYYLYCLDAETGEVVWKEETGNYIVSTPSIIDQGDSQAVCFGGCDGLLYVIPTSGRGEKKEIEIGSYIANSSAVRDGIAYMAHNGGEVLALDIESGETVWRQATGVEYTASPAVDETHVYVAGPDKRLVAYDRILGEADWAFTAPRALDSSPVIAGDTIWQGGTDGRIYAIDRRDGKELWSFELGAQIKASPAVSRGALVVCGQDGVVYAFR
mgnify:CR=1 FL=1